MHGDAKRLRDALFLACRFAVEDMSEAPIITPLTLLGDFVTDVGPEPPQNKLTTYFARLREQARSP